MVLPVIQVAMIANCVMVSVRVVTTVIYVTVYATEVAIQDVIIVKDVTEIVKAVTNVRVVTVAVIRLVMKGVMTVRVALEVVRGILVPSATQPATTILQQPNRLRAETLQLMVIRE